MFSNLGWVHDINDETLLLATNEDGCLFSSDEVAYILSDSIVAHRIQGFDSCDVHSLGK
jgi:hypothetical protein